MRKIVVGGVWKCIDKSDEDYRRFGVITDVLLYSDSSIVTIKYSNGRTFSWPKKWLLDGSHEYKGMLPSRESKKVENIPIQGTYRQREMIEAIMKAQERVAGCLGVPVDLISNIGTVSEVELPKRIKPSKEVDFQYFSEDDFMYVSPEKLKANKELQELLFFLRMSSRLEDLSITTVMGELMQYNRMTIMHAVSMFLVERSRNIERFKKNAEERQRNNLSIQGGANNGK
jgi:hypothetical protein